MFDIGFPELLLIAIVALLVIGPERLPETLRTLGLWLGRMRRSFTAVKNEIEKEIGMDEIRRQLHNEAVLEELKRIERDVQSTLQQASGTPQGSANGSATGPQPDAPAEEPSGAAAGTIERTPEHGATYPREQPGTLEPDTLPPPSPAAEKRPGQDV